MGGGTILILLLSIFLKFDQHIAQATNLIFFIPTAVASIITNLKNKNILWKEAIPIIIMGILGASFSAQLSSKMNVNLLRKLFGIFLILIAIYEIYSLYKMYINKKIRHNSNR